MKIPIWTHQLTLLPGRSETYQKYMKIPQQWLEKHLPMQWGLILRKVLTKICRHCHHLSDPQTRRGLIVFLNCPLPLLHGQSGSRKQTRRGLMVKNAHRTFPLYQSGNPDYHHHHHHPVGKQQKRRKAT
jgi:hypothetical protein